MGGDSGVRMVFFDAGDTLLCPQPSFPGLAARVLRERGHEVIEEEVTRAARAVASHFRRVEGEAISAQGRDRNRAFWMGLYADLLVQLGLVDEGAPVKLVDTFSDPLNYDLFPDAVPTLDALAGRGLRLGVISNFEPWLGGLLERLQVHHRFEVVAISGELGWEKPDPRIFEWALDRAELTPRECMHVGDQPYFDAEPAEVLGLRPVLIDRYGRFDELETSYPKVASLTELLGLVGDGRRP